MMLEAGPDSRTRELIEYIDAVAPALEPLEVAVEAGANAAAALVHDHALPVARQNDGAGQPGGAHG